MNQEQTEAEARTAAFKSSWEYLFFDIVSSARTLCVLLIFVKNFGYFFFVCLIFAEFFLMGKKAFIKAMIENNKIEDREGWESSAVVAFVGYGVTAAVVISGVDVHSAGSIVFIVILFMPLPFDIMLLKYSPWYRQWKVINPNAPQQLA